MAKCHNPDYRSCVWTLKYAFLILHIIGENLGKIFAFLIPEIMYLKMRKSYIINDIEIVVEKKE